MRVNKLRVLIDLIFLIILCISYKIFQQYINTHVFSEIFWFLYILDCNYSKCFENVMIGRLLIRFIRNEDVRKFVSCF